MIGNGLTRPTAVHKAKVLLSLLQFTIGDEEGSEVLSLWLKDAQFSRAFTILLRARNARYVLWLLVSPILH